MKPFMIYLLALGVFLTATSELIVSGILYAIADDLHISLALAGQLITAYSLAFAIGTPFLVSLTSRINRKKVLLGSLLLFIVGSLASYASSHVWLLMGSRIILGISSGVYLVAAMGTAAKLVPPDKLGRAIGTIVLGFSSAMVLGVPLGITITNMLNWQSIFLLLALLTLLVAFVLAKLLPDVEGDAAVPFHQQFKVLGSVVILSALFLTFFRESGNSVLFTYITPFIQDIFHIKPSSISLMMLVFGLFGAIGSKLGGYAIDRFGPSRVITLSTLIHIGVFALLPLLSGKSLIGLMLISIMVLSMFAAGPAVQSYFIQRAPGSSNLILSLNTSVVHFGLAAGAGAGGFMLNTTSTLQYHPWLGGVVLALGLAAGLISFAAGKRELLPQST
ncbi:major facilitator superfamily MFS_1 [Paenibacillus vortex V453]|uniref:Major facilitator superfamily MFS_1 n=1 Tax=Paenibacillus vortex V453 TaxID=715225 RepID=A0A2R9SPH6_9BACL|nr:MULTISPECIES: MFS transporter [Paenibacillus]EFU39242.1 major facilitator superfamily MFS_1 [Paenibacillus vortex V453]MDH6670007.1 DHA1 family putative efflux transporter-like MFS transporter [Paenibacillus sp. LBL]MPY16785.1 MFS transporter [Paenibacillus glucanolyticus]OMF71346.1 MFS transporter [Paenibacillus glucanolyticus]